MNKRILLSVIVVLAAMDIVFCQQVPDLEYEPPVHRPAYALGEGPRIVIDEAHYNFHTADGRYRPFADVLRRDGYCVDGFRKPFSSDSLHGADVVVIANALHERNEKDRGWLPILSAFTKDEIVAVRAWVEKGGSLFLIADHMPFAGAAIDLAEAFDVEFSNGYARAGSWNTGKPNTFERETGLLESAITRGRADDEKVTVVATFTGSAFRPPKDATAIMLFGAKSVSLTPEKVQIEGWCQGAVMNVGNGRVAVFGEAAMFSAQLAGSQKQPIGMNTPVAKQNHQLLLNVMHWLTRVKGMPD
jgi:hypothetical protein